MFFTNCKTVLAINITNTVSEDIAFYSLHLLAPPQGEPTLAEKAQQFIDSLGLGERTKDFVSPVKVSTNLKVANTTAPVSKSKRQVGSGLPVACPASQAEKAICTDITGKQQASAEKQLVYQVLIIGAVAQPLQIIVFVLTFCCMASCPTSVVYIRQHGSAVYVGMAFVCML